MAIHQYSIKQAVEKALELRQQVIDDMRAKGASLQDTWEYPDAISTLINAVEKENESGK